MGPYPVFLAWLESSDQNKNLPNALALQYEYSSHLTKYKILSRVSSLFVDLGLLTLGLISSSWNR